MIRDLIRKDLQEAAKKLGYEPKSAEVVRSQNEKFGDFATNVALKIRHKDYQSSMEVANVLAQSLKDQPYVKKLEVKEPGFINFFVKDEVWQKEVEDVLKTGARYGANQLGKDKKARVEFISANPTGPLHFGNARGGPIGDSLASVFEFSGYEVLREYYNNDVGSQVEKLGQSIINVQKRGKLEDQEYKGEYVRELADKIKALNAEDAGRQAVGILSSETTNVAKEMGIIFDKIYSESGFSVEKERTKSDKEHLVRSVLTEEVLQELGQKGFLKEKEGAVWFAPSAGSGQGRDQFLEDRECVIKKSDGNYTYFANDIAYHKLKFSEGADLVIDILGANHHGHVSRMKAAVSALGFDASHFHVILYQWVRFKRRGELVKMSKRSGTFVTAQEVLEEVGKDALRFFLLMYDANSHIDFDLDLAKEHSSKNPVYYVQYAHARICSILTKAGPVGRESKAGSVSGFPPASARSDQKLKDEQIDQADLRAVGSPSTAATRFELLSTEYELNLIKQITKLPELVEEISQTFGVHRLTGYARELADSFHKFYENCQVLTEDKELQSARLTLIKATQIALANTLGLLGVSAPEKM